LQAELVHFQFLGIRTIANTTDATYRVTNWWTLHGGYQFSNRRIQSIEQVSFANTPDAVRGEQENTLHAGTFGMRLRPEKRLSILLDAEVGRSDRPFFPVSDKNYQLFSGRIQWKSKSLLLSAAARSNYNTNSSTLSAYSSRSRGYSADATWTPATWFSFDAGYNKMHLDTMSGIAYFSAGEFIDNDRSVYISNIHAANLGMRFGIGRRIDLYLGYSRVQDTGDGRSLGAALLVGTPNSVVSPFYFAQTFPLSFESPLARVSVRLSNKIRWNVGYQYYRYGEEFGDIQDYRAHTGFTSLTWAF
jgi:hypothetical protein